MPLFNEDAERHQTHFQGNASTLVHSLEDTFKRQIPVSSIEFNPPPVPDLARREFLYWINLEEPDAEDRKILRALKGKYKALKASLAKGTFVSITDSAAGVLRIHNIAMMRLLADQAFTRKHFGSDPLVWEPRRTIVHLTRNHSINWLRKLLTRCHREGFHNILAITGDPLKEVRLKGATADQITEFEGEDLNTHRPKNSVELIRFIKNEFPHFYVGVGHNPFMRNNAGNKHLLNKVEAGAQFIITQPVSYYEECWQAVADFATFRKEQSLTLPVVLGVFNYFVPCHKNGYDPEKFEKRYKFWKKLFGFVPEGVRQDYDSGLDGIEILARSIGKLKRMGYFHFDVMNAEKHGADMVQNEMRMAHEQDRLLGAYQSDQRVP
jgi:hypothetical protein